MRVEALSGAGLRYAYVNLHTASRSEIVVSPADAKRHLVDRDGCWRLLVSFDCTESREEGAPTWRSAVCDSVGETRRRLGRPGELAMCV